MISIDIDPARRFPLLPCAPPELPEDPLPQAEKYKGDFSNGLREGRGSLTYPNGDSYEGEFANDFLHGQGTFRYRNGSCYVGQFSLGCRHGYGVFTNVEGDVYRGNWDNDRMRGTAGITINGEYSYEGNILNGKRHGNGRCTFPDGDMYDGEFYCDEITGNGTYYFADGSKCMGHFKKGKMDGKGTFTDMNGDYYIGLWQEGQKHGKGSYYFSGEDPFKRNCFVGTWEEGSPKGPGVLSFVNGDVLEGIFDKGQLQEGSRMVLAGKSLQQVEEIRKHLKTEIKEAARDSFFLLGMVYMTLPLIIVPGLLIEPAGKKKRFFLNLNEVSKIYEKNLATMQPENAFRSAYQQIFNQPPEFNVSNKHSVQEEVKVESRLLPTAAPLPKISVKRSPAKPEVFDVISYGAHLLRKWITEPDGLCALHALFGDKVNGVYRTETKRHEFAQELQIELAKGPNSIIWNDMRAFFEGLCTSANNDRGYDLQLKDNLRILLNSRILPELNRIHNIESQRIQELHRVRWAILQPVEEFIRNDARLSQSFARFYRDGNAQITLEESLKRQFGDILRWFENNRGQGPLQQAYQRLLETVQQEQTINRERYDFMDGIFPELFARYISRFKQEDYYLSSHELKMFGTFKGVEFTLLTANDLQLPRESQVLDRNHRVIFHEGLHYMRCEF